MLHALGSLEILFQNSNVQKREENLRKKYENLSFFGCDLWINFQHHKIDIYEIKFLLSFILCIVLLIASSCCFPFSFFIICDYLKSTHTLTWRYFKYIVWKNEKFIINFSCIWEFFDGEADDVWDGSLILFQYFPFKNLVHLLIFFPFFSFR